MNMRNYQIIVAAVAVCLEVGSGQAQGFTSGSDGSYGPINVTADTTLALPPDGIFHATTITVAANATLSFRRNALNTPVYLLATGDVVINGDIDVAGRVGNSVVGGDGGPGGFNGGTPGSVSTPPGAGYGPGAGRGGTHTYALAGSAGAGVYATTANYANSTNNGATYGSALLVPIVGGSGGGGSAGAPGSGGGGGGGALLIASSTRISLGTSSVDLTASGAVGASIIANGGSGGAIRLVAPVITGSGANLRVHSNGGGGAGRIRIDAFDRTGMNLNFSPAGVTSVGSMMVVFPTPNPRLDIIEAAGTAIPEGSGPVSLLLPFGSDPNRTIKVQARDFNDSVPIALVLTPDNGPPTLYQSVIDNRAANPATTTINVALPLNVQTYIHAWTR